MQNVINFIMTGLPEAIKQGKLRLPLTWIFVIGVAWFAAGIMSYAIASFIPAPTLPKNAAARQARFQPDEALLTPHARYHYDVIGERNIFDSTNKVANVGKEKIDTSKSLRNLDGPPQLSTLPVKLVGTIVSTDPALSLATITASGKPNAEQYAVGDRLMGAAVVTQIERNRVYLMHNGAKEYIETDDAKSATMDSEPGLDNSVAMLTPANGVRETAPGKYTVDRGRVVQVMSNLNEVMTQARVVPHFENGKASGWKIFAIKPNSIYQELTLENGDIIQRINGVEVDSPARALEMYQQLASESHITIDLIRRGSKQTFDYDIR